MTCKETPSSLSRYADDPSALEAGIREEVETHLAACGECRAALEAQREVGRLLRQRPRTPVRTGFAARVAARIDRESESEGWLGLANWRAWTVGLAPVAAALLVAAYLDGAQAVGTPGSESTPTLQEWTAPASTATPADIFLQPSTTGDALIEAILTGTTAASGEPDGR